MKISSDTSIPNIEAHFKVVAGPGAGKTKWLIHHIKNVLHHSTRLGIVKKIGCITYTNVAVEAIVKKLGESADRVEVSTIHSFLYFHVVKPYLSFIAQEYGFLIHRLDGHEDPFVSTKMVLSWLENHPSRNELVHPYSLNQLTKLPNSKIALARWLKTLSIELSSGSIRWATNRSEAYYIDSNGKRMQLNRKCLDTLEKDYIGYKKMYWAKGILVHDDVLYFSFILLQRFPFIAMILRAKFPYIFCDEFQDINPIQKSILEQISQSVTVIGIIGDRAQSIYSFQGASPTQLDTFFSTEVNNYVIEENWRSTDSIVALLNYIRRDIQQVPKRGLMGDLPRILVGDKLAAFQAAKELCIETGLYCLTRDNLTANVLRKGVTGSITADLLEELFRKDANAVRPKVMVRCIEAMEYALQGYYRDALKALYRLELVRTHSEPKKKALALLKLLLDEEPSLRNLPLIQLYEFITRQGIATLARFSGSNPRNFYESVTYTEISTAIKNLNESSQHRTIHKSKGDEFDNVLVVFDAEVKGGFDETKALNFLLSPNLNDEEQRIKYVAVSRARNQIFISVPVLSKEHEAFLMGKGLIVTRIT